MTLFRDRHFSAAIAANFLVGASLIVAMVDVPVITAMLVDPAAVSRTAALMLAPFTVLIAALSFAGGRIVGRAGLRLTAAAGLVLVAIGYAALWLGLRGGELIGMIPGLALAGAGFGLVFAPIGATAIDAAPAADRGIAAAMTLVFRLLGMTIGISTLTAIAVRRLQGLVGNLGNDRAAAGRNDSGFSGASDSAPLRDRPADQPAGRARDVSPGRCHRPPRSDPGRILCLSSIVRRGLSAEATTCTMRAGLSLTPAEGTMPRSVVLGVDSSTQSTKVIAVDMDSGETPAKGALRTAAATFSIPPNGGTRSSRPRARAVAPDMRVAAISVGGQQHGMVTLDADDEVVRPAPLWNNVDAAPDAERLNALADFGRETGSRLVASFTIAKLAHLARTAPEDLARTAAVGLPHDWLNLRLTGNLVTDRGEASGSGWWSPRDGRERRDLLALAVGAKTAERLQLPEVRGPDEPPGHCSRTPPQLSVCRPESRSDRGRVTTWPPRSASARARASS